MSKVVVVTGASAGIGQSICTLLTNKGYVVYGLSRRKVVDEPYFNFQVDITNVSSVRDAIETIVENEGHIDVFINNAGMGISGSVEGTSIEDAKNLFDVNFFAAFQAIQIVIPYMRQQGYGKIINISSLAAAFPIPFQAFYSASKAALSSLSHALNNELKPFHIGVSVILPGDIKSEFSKHRKKNLEEDESYGKRVKKSIETMEKDEYNGMEPIVISKTVLKLIKKKRMPIELTVGLKYKSMLFLKRIVSSTSVNRIIGMIYGFHKKK
jgi:short-subunit dehydrogenase